MNRGSASFTTMKGFMGDFVVKGDGHEEETLPLDTGMDVTETAELDDARAGAPKAANIKKSDNKPGDPTTTMSEELKEVEAGAETDIADSYVSDVQHLPGPGDRVKKGLGYEDFNNMVAKGHVVQVSSGMNVHNVHDTIGMVQKSAMEDFDLMAREASPYTMKGFDNDLSLGGFEDLTVGKGLSSLVYKGDTEDMGLEDGYTEDEDSGDYVEESDDDKETQGMNEPSPQTGEAEARADAVSGDKNPEEAEAEDEDPIEDEMSSDETTDALGKGWNAYNSGFAAKGFNVEMKGRSGGSQPGWLGAKVREARHWAKTNRGKRSLLTGAGIAAAGGLGYGTAKYVNKKDKKKKTKGFESYNSGFAAKGFTIQTKVLLSNTNYQAAEDEIRRQRGEKPKLRKPSLRQHGPISDEYLPKERKTTTGYVPEGTKPRTAPGPANPSSVVGSQANRAALTRAAEKKAKNAPGRLRRTLQGAKKFITTPSWKRAAAVGAVGGAGALGAGYALGRDKGVDDQGIIVKAVHQTDIVKKKVGYDIQVKELSDDLEVKSWKSGVLGATAGGLMGAGVGGTSGWLAADDDAEKVGAQRGAIIGGLIGAAVGGGAAAKLFAGSKRGHKLASLGNTDAALREHARNADNMILAGGLGTVVAPALAGRSVGSHAKKNKGFSGLIETKANLSSARNITGVPKYAKRIIANAGKQPKGKQVTKRVRSPYRLPGLEDI